MKSLFASAALAVFVSACLAQDRIAAPARSPAQPATQPAATEPSTRPGVFAPPPETLPGAQHDQPFFPGAAYDAAVPTPVAVMGPELGEGRRPAAPQEIVACLLAWQDQPRVKLVQIGQTHAGRPLYEVIVTSPANHARLEEIQRGWQRLADPRGLDDAEAQRLLGSLPPVAWLGYSIHGDETTGADAAVQVLYHLIAGTDEATTKLLEETVIIIDPMLNPDGRARYLNQQRDARTRAPVVDDQDNQVVGGDPAGRTNHYQFDLNRDWTYATQPESKARLRMLRDWYPMIMVDAHEMSSQDTYLFGPSREPANPHLPAARAAQRRLFGDEQGRAFDQHGWRYYSGEWAEEWYPGYTDGWAAYRGSVGILYEQSHRGAIGVRRPEGFIATYRDGVHQQLVSSMANLASLQRHRGDLARSFLEERRRNVAADNPVADRVFVFVPRGNGGREAELAELLKLQGLECFVTEGDLELPRAIDRLGRTADGRRVPAGTLLVPNRQPHAPLVSTLLEFDVRFTADFLRKERQHLLRQQGGLLYDVSAWGLPMFLDVEAYEARFNGGLPQQGVRPLRDADAWPVAAPQAGGVDRRDAAVGYVIDGADDRSVAAAGRLMERGVEVKVSLRPFQFGQRAFARGSILVSRQDNQRFGARFAADNGGGDFVDVLDDVARKLGVVAYGIDTGTGTALPADDLDPVDIGGGFFRRLEPPRIGVFTRGARGGNYTAGEVWHTLDARLGLRATYLNTDYAAFGDLRRYNVIVLPDLPRPAVEPMREALEQWVRAGGTLVAIGESAAVLASGEKPIGSVRRLRDVLADVAPYEQAVLRHLTAEDAQVDLDALYGRTLPSKLDFPWARRDPLPKEELERRDTWQRLFSPQGVVLAARIDKRHWLTAGADEPMPALVGSSTVLMASDGAEAPVRFGIVEQVAAGEGPATQPAGAAQTQPATQPGGEGEAGPPPGWVSLPEGQRTLVRMSGLLWPEYAPRVAHAPYVTRESVGAGQVILFPERPAFRGATLGTMRLMTNALVYGPGCGASAPILP